MVSMATPVNRKAEMKAGLSPKFSMPIARAPRMTVKLSHDRKVRSLAKKTLGSTRVGSAIRLPVHGETIGQYGGQRTMFLRGEGSCLPGAVWSRGWLDMLESQLRLEPY